MVFNALSSVGMTRKKTQKLRNYFDKLYSFCLQDIDKNDKKGIRKLKDNLRKTASFVTSNGGSIGRNYYDIFVFPFFEGILEYMPNVYYKPLVADIFNDIIKFQYLAILNEISGDLKKCGGSIFESLKNPSVTVNCVKEELSLHETTFKILNGKPENAAKEKNLLGIDTYIKKANEFSRKYENSRDIILRYLASRELKEADLVKLLNDNLENPIVSMLMPVLKEFSGTEIYLQSLSWLATNTKYSREEQQNAEERIKKAIHSVEKMSNKVLKGRGRNISNIQSYLDLCKWGTIAIALRNRKWLPNIGISHIGTKPIDLAFGIDSISYHLFIDDYVSLEFDNTRKVRVNPHPAIERLGYGNNSYYITETLIESGLHVTNEMKKELESFFHNYIVNYTGNSGALFKQAKQTCTYYNKKSYKNIYQYNIGNKEVSVVSLPTGKKLLKLANDLVEEVLKKHLVKNPFEKQKEWQKIKDNPIQLGKFICWEIVKTSAKDKREELEMYSDLLLGQPTFAMVHYTKMNPGSFFFRSTDGEWRDLFTGWATGSCTNPMKGAKLLTYKQLDQIGVWWNGYQWGVDYLVKGNNGNSNSVTLDSFEVHPAFFKKFHDKTGFKHDAIDELLCSATLTVSKEKNKGRDFYVHPDSNQKRIVKQLKSFSKSCGRPLHYTTVKDDYLDVKYSVMNNIYCIGGKNA